jgi:outer membrane protein OmpA-like peptidoglycan-associated protein
MSPTVVRIGGVEFRDGDGQLISVKVVLAEGSERTRATVVVADPLFEISSSLPLPHEDAKVPVEVFAGDKVFSGYLSTVTSSLSSSSPGKISLTASDTFSSSRRSSNARVLTDASAAQQMEILAQEAGLELVFQGDSENQLNRVQYGQRVQRGSSDAKLLRETLEALGHTYQVREDRLYVRPVGDRSGDIVEVAPGSDGNLESISFTIKELDRNTTPNVDSRAGDSTFEQNLNLDPDVQARAVRLERTGVLFEARDLPSFTDQTLERAQNAQARARKIFKAKAKLINLNISLDVDSQVLLRGLGPRFSGVWNVERVTHSLSPLRSTSLDLYNGGGNDSGGVITFISDQVLFDFDIDVFGPEYEAVLDRVASRLALYSETHVIVTGHADEVGTDAYNKDLALRRANSVYNALLKRGIAASRMSVVSKGESDPAGTIDALNRRVNFVIK